MNYSTNNIQKDKLYYIIFASAFLLLFPYCIQSSSPTLFSQNWNETFKLHRTESGDTVSIGAIFSDTAAIYIYNLANGSIVQLDRTGSIVKQVSLQPIGRRTYFGDDFIVTNNECVFLNSVDRRFDFFEYTNGTFSHSVPFPDPLFSDEEKRSHRIVNRIFLSGNNIFIGNAHRVAVLKTILGKQARITKTFSAPKGQRFALIEENRHIVSDGQTLYDQSTEQSYSQPDSHYPMTGKRVFSLNGRLFTIILSKSSVRIVELQ